MSDDPTPTPSANRSPPIAPVLCSSAGPGPGPSPLCLMIGMELDGEPSAFSGWLTVTIHRRDAATFAELAARLRDMADRIEADYLDDQPQPRQERRARHHGQRLRASAGKHGPDDVVDVPTEAP